MRLRSVVALWALLVGAAIVPAIGPASPKIDFKPTFANDVAPILYKRCISCHSESRVAPFSLVGYENAQKRALTIARVTQSGYMPPWRAQTDFGEFRDVPLLTDHEKRVLAKWADGGAPRGDADSEPTPPTMTPGWRLGSPDLVVTAVKPTKIPSEGADFFRDYLIDPHITKPTWVRAVDFRPSQKGTVHHIIPGLLSKSDAEKCRKIKFDHDDDSWEQDSLDDVEPYSNLGFWSTGAPPFESPKGTAFLIKPGDQILLDVHYKTTGKPELEHPEVGLYFVAEKPKEVMTTRVISTNGIYLQPKQRDVRVFALGEKLRTPTTVYAVWPHMHYLGQTFKAWVKYPDGSWKPLVSIQKWDPEWQLLYYLKEPLTLPKGSKVYVTGTYDNSSSNPLNPHSPPKVVEAGPSSKDEMLFFELFQVVHGKPGDKSDANSTANGP